MYRGRAPCYSDSGIQNIKFLSFAIQAKRKEFYILDRHGRYVLDLTSSTGINPVQPTLNVFRIVLMLKRRNYPQSVHFHRYHFRELHFLR